MCVILHLPTSWLAIDLTCDCRVTGIFFHLSAFSQLTAVSYNAHGSL
jgi:hypothetical protein